MASSEFLLKAREDGRTTSINKSLGQAVDGDVGPKNRARRVVLWTHDRVPGLVAEPGHQAGHSSLSGPGGVRFLGKLASLVIYLAAFACYAHVIPELQTLGKSLLAGVGVASVVVGLAAQSTLGNLIAGISLVLYRPFKLGDRLQISAPTGPETGMVVNIDLGYTILRTADQRLIVIPNSVVASQSTLNLTALAPRTACNISLYVATGSDLAKARQILLNAAKAQPKITQVDGCFATRVTSRGVIMTLSAACANPDDATGIKSDLLESAKKQFDAAGIRLV